MILDQVMGSFRQTGVNQWANIIASWTFVWKKKFSFYQLRKTNNLMVNTIRLNINTPNTKSDKYRFKINRAFDIYIYRLYLISGSRLRHFYYDWPLKWRGNLSNTELKLWNNCQADKLKSKTSWYWSPRLFTTARPFKNRSMGQCLSCDVFLKRTQSV